VAISGIHKVDVDDTWILERLLTPESD